MSPKKPLRPKPSKASTEAPLLRPDATPDVVSWRPTLLPGDAPGQTPGHRIEPAPLQIDIQRTGVEISDLPPDTVISRIPADLPITQYLLPLRMVETLPAADPHTGFRTIVSGRRYVDLLEGGTVALGDDAQGHFRARQMTELTPSGPRLERVAETDKWRLVVREGQHTGDSELIVKRRRVPDDESPQPGLSKRPRASDEAEPLGPAKARSTEPGQTVGDDSASRLAPPTSASGAEPWADWAIAPHQASPEDLNIAGEKYRTLPHGAVEGHSIVYIRNPAHQPYDFIGLQTILSQAPAQQPRGAIMVPPTYHWEIDPTLPFEKHLTDQVASYFPELTQQSSLIIAREQFVRANGGDKATGIGLTTLRQIFNDWKSLNTHPRPELADPLLMLPITTASAGRGTAREIRLPALSESTPLHRLEFDPGKFQQEWNYFRATQSGLDLKRFMAKLLTRNGYTVFEPTSATSFPALVFQRTGHDFVFYMSLHRVRGSSISLLPATSPALSRDRLLEQVGSVATQAMQHAHAVAKLVWLKGGSQVQTGSREAAFILRIENQVL